MAQAARLCEQPKIENPLKIGLRQRAGEPTHFRQKKDFVFKYEVFFLFYNIKKLFSFQNSKATKNIQNRNKRTINNT